MKIGSVVKIIKLMPIDIFNDVRLGELGVINGKRKDTYLVVINNIEHEMFRNQLEEVNLND